MATAQYSIKPNPKVPPCPKCGNNTHFTCRAEQVSEDMCEVWVTCKCRHDATNGDGFKRLEDVWGDVGQDSFFDALRFTWIELLT